uniref:Uncharacterized protein n=1 Tax=Leersia perrieri TaxID=77586 RepID=A0A0D9XT11_9ORYZ
MAALPRSGWGNLRPWTLLDRFMLWLPTGSVPRSILASESNAAIARNKIPKGPPSPETDSMAAIAGERRITNSPPDTVAMGQ